MCNSNRRDSRAVSASPPALCFAKPRSSIAPGFIFSLGFHQDPFREAILIRGDTEDGEVWVYKGLCPSTGRENTISMRLKAGYLHPTDSRIPSLLLTRYLADMKFIYEVRDFDTRAQSRNEDELTRAPPSPSRAPWHSSYREQHPSRPSRVFAVLPSACSIPHSRLPSLFLLLSGLRVWPYRVVR